MCACAPPRVGRSAIRASNVTRAHRLPFTQKDFHAAAHRSIVTHREIWTMLLSSSRTCERHARRSFHRRITSGATRAVLLHKWAPAAEFERRRLPGPTFASASLRPHPVAPRILDHKAERVCRLPARLPANPRAIDATPNACHFAAAGAALSAVDTGGRDGATEGERGRKEKGHQGHWKHVACTPFPGAVRARVPCVVSSWVPQKGEVPSRRLLRASRGSQQRRRKATQICTHYNDGISCNGALAELRCSRVCVACRAARSCSARTLPPLRPQHATPPAGSLISGA